MSDWTLYGVRGFGSTLAEGALAWVGQPYEFVDVEGFDRPGKARDRLEKVNPLARVPTLVMPGGEVLTESAAIVLRLAELHPDKGLAPAPDAPDRAAFLDRLMWLVSVVYPTFSYRDYPDRWAPDAKDQLVERVDRFRESQWRRFDAELSPGDWALPCGPSAIDLYVAVMGNWLPGKPWFASETPALHALAERAAALPQIAGVIAANFPDGASK